MIGELDLNGIFLSPALVSAVIAFAVFVVVRRIIERVGAYRFVWHAALFDGSVFVILWAAVAALPWPQWN